MVGRLTIHCHRAAAKIVGARPARCAHRSRSKVARGSSAARCRGSKRQSRGRGRIIVSPLASERECRGACAKSAVGGERQCVPRRSRSPSRRCSLRRRKCGALEKKASTEVRKELERDLGVEWFCMATCLLHRNPLHRSAAPPSMLLLASPVSVAQATLSHPVKS